MKTAIDAAGRIVTDTAHMTRRRSLFAVMAFALVLVGCSNSSQNSATATSQPALTSAKGVASATPTPYPVPEDEIVAGITVQPLVVGAPLPLPANLTVYYVPAGYGKDATLPDLRRVYRDTGGPLKEDRLFKDLGTVYTVALNLDEGLIGVGVCDNQKRGTFCGTPSYAATADSMATGYISTDGGATFTNLGRLPRNAWVYATLNDELLIGVYDPETPATPTRFAYFPSGTVVESPIPGAIPLRLTSAGLVWLADGALYGADGSPLLKIQTPGLPSGLRMTLTPSRFVETWRKTGSGGLAEQASPTFYLGIFNAAGTLQRVFSWKGDVRPTVRISAHEVLGNFEPTDTQGLTFPAMILDLDTGVIHPITELTQALRASGDLREPFIVAVEPFP